MIKKILTLLTATILAFSVISSYACENTADNANYKYTVELKDNGEYFSNEGMGWNFAYYGNSLDSYGADLNGDWGVIKDETIQTLENFPCDIIYIRIGWNFIQPDKEFYNNVLKPLGVNNADESKLGNSGYFYWEVIDRVAEKWTARGHKLCFRIVANDGWGQSTPLWLKDKGCKGVEYDPILDGCQVTATQLQYEYDAEGNKITDANGKYVYTQESLARCYRGMGKEGKLWYNSNGTTETDYGKGRKTWCPDFGDDLYIEYHTKMLEKLRDRYSEFIEFVEIGSVGTWGEGHYNRALPTVDFLDSEAYGKNVEMFREVFGNDYLVLTWDDLSSKNGELYNKCMEYGFGVTEDSLQVPPWPKGGYEAPNDAALTKCNLNNNVVGLETHPDQPSTIMEYYRYLDEYHGSYARLYISPKKQLVSQAYDIMTKRMGYRIEFTKAEISEPARGKEAKVRLSLRNVGTAQCYGGGYPMITIVDESFKVVSQGVSSFNVASLEVGNDENISKFIEEHYKEGEELNAQSDIWTALYGKESLKTTKTGSNQKHDLESVSCEVSLTIPSDLKDGRYYVLVGVADKDGKPFMNLPLDFGSDIDKMYKIATLNIGA